MFAQISRIGAIPVFRSHCLKIPVQWSPLLWIIFTTSFLRDFYRWKISKMWMLFDTEDRMNCAGGVCAIADRACCSQIDCYSLADCKLAYSDTCMSTPVRCAVGMLSRSISSKKPILIAMSKVCFRHSKSGFIDLYFVTFIFFDICLAITLRLSAPQILPAFESSSFSY